MRMAQENVCDANSLDVRRLPLNKSKVATADDVPQMAAGTANTPIRIPKVVVLSRLPDWKSEIRACPARILPMH
jgi:hypothetical protein